MTRWITAAVAVFMAVSGTLYFCAVPFVFSAANALIIASFALCAASFSTLLRGEWTIGMIPPAATALLIFLLARYRAEFATPRLTVPNAVLYVVTFALALLRIFFISVQMIMLTASLRGAEKGREYTLVVLGTRLKNGKPGAMLMNRLRAAQKYLKRHPEVKCIVTGGCIGDEQTAEADAMSEYLLGAGIETDRIFTEACSATTDENISFSKRIAHENSLPQAFLIVTDRFHQLRAGLICRDNSVEARSLNSPTPLYQRLQYWSREVLCLIERWMTK